MATQRITMRMKLQDIILIISWREMARQYFGKSSSWLYHKLDGINGNGGEDDFSDDEKAMLRSSLFDLSERIRKSADNL